MEVLNLATLEKQNEILAYIPVEGGRKYNDLCLISTAAIDTSGVELVNITGKGYVTKILTKMEYIDFEIEVDGEIVFKYVDNSATPRLLGIINEKYIPEGLKVRLFSAIETFVASELGELPVNEIAGTTNKIVLLPLPIKFATSLVVRLKRTTGSKGAVPYEIIGGVE